MSRRIMNFLEVLQQRAPLLADGATGTMLQAAGLPVGEAPERWVLDNPAAVRKLAAQYADAGSDLVYTCTFGASRVQLRRCGLEDRFEAINRTAVQLAREAAAGRAVLLAGSIGPTGEMLEPYGEFSSDEARQSFAEQAALLAAAGVDALVCETFADLSEALLAVEAACATNLPILASMTFDRSGRTMMGVTPEDAVAKLSDAGAVAVGANCSVGPEVVERVIRAMKAARPKVPLVAKPNAGLPQFVGGKTLYATTPQAMAEFAMRMNKIGVAILGGCCGSTPEHIRAIRGAIP
jgi:5-methyltetrahydrofolate--homocysteine methyltransferase